MNAHLYNVAKDWDNAEKDFTTALEMATLVKSVWFQGRSLRGLGYIAIERKQWDKAVDYYHRALR